MTPHTSRHASPRPRRQRAAAHSTPDPTPAPSSATGPEVAAGTLREGGAPATPASADLEALPVPTARNTRLTYAHTDAWSRRRTAAVVVAGTLDLLAEFELRQALHRHAYFLTGPLGLPHLVTAIPSDPQQRPWDPWHTLVSLTETDDAPDWPTGTHRNNGDLETEHSAMDLAQTIVNSGHPWDDQAERQRIERDLQ